MDDTNRKAHELILEIYDAAIEPGKWPDALSHACEFVGATGAVVFEMTGTPDVRPRSAFSCPPQVANRCCSAK